MFYALHRRYWPDEDDASLIEEIMTNEYKNTQRDQKASDQFLFSLTHLFLLKITRESANFRERKELLDLYFYSFSFISCVIAVTMRRFIEHDFFNIIGFCNYVWNHCNSLCKVFLRVIDHSNIDPKILISKKGVNHYAKIKIASKNQSIA